MAKLLDILRKKVIRTTLCGILFLGGLTTGIEGGISLYHHQHDKDEKLVENYGKNWIENKNGYNSNTDLMLYSSHQRTYHKPNSQYALPIIYSLGGAYVGFFVGGGIAIWTNIALMTKEERKEFFTVDSYDAPLYP